MSEVFYANTEALRESARALEDKNNERELALSEIDALLHALPDSWLGEAGRAILERFEDERAALSKLDAFFMSYADLLKRAADKIDAADEALEQTFRGI